MVQLRLVAQIYKSKANYILALKANHPTLLHGQVKDCLSSLMLAGLKVLTSAMMREWKRHYRTENAHSGVFQFRNYHLYTTKMIG